MLFKEAHHDHSSQYLIESWIYTFTSTSTQTVGEGHRQFLDVPYMKLTLAMNPVSLNSMQKFITFKKTKQEKAYKLWGELHCLLDKSPTVNFFHGVIIINVAFIIYHWKGQPFFYLKQFLFLIFIQLREEVMIFLKSSYKKIRVISFPW